jgi:hypothetical protein
VSHTNCQLNVAAKENVLWTQSIGDVLQRKTGKTDGLRSLRKWSCSTCSPTCNQKYRPNRLSTKSLAKLDLNWRHPECETSVSISESKQTLPFLNCTQLYRDVREYKSRVESYSRDLLRKEAQIKELQVRLDNGDGSKFHRFYYFPSNSSHQA